MSGTSNIQWTDATWNPTVGCTRVTSGCNFCYAFQLHDQRFRAWHEGRWPEAPEQYRKPFSADYRPYGSVERQGVQLLPDRLRDPYHWRKPRRVFVNSAFAKEVLAALYVDSFAPRFVIQGIDLVTKAIANLIDFAVFNLHTGSNTRINREGSHKSRLLNLHLQIWQHGLAQHLGALAENLKSVLRLHVGMPSQVGLVVELHSTSLKALCEPVDDAAMCHGDSHDGVDTPMSLWPYSGHIDRTFTIYQSRDVGTLFWRECRNRISRTLGLALGFQPRIARPVIVSLSRLLLVVHSFTAPSVKEVYHD